MLSHDLRTKFLRYFKEKGHVIVPSAPTLPHHDPTLLFTNAGMNQFKEVFLGEETRPYRQATSAQKCIRVGGKHNDLDNVGHTSRHMTFFEMLGNFSFGAYGKKEAIAYAFDVSTSIFGFDPEHIWASVFEEDDESFELWHAWLPTERIVRFGASENFWSMGETGPCGPCSELLLDRGPAFGTASTPLEDRSGERYMEFWNLVFMQSQRLPQGKLIPLPQIAVDTGAGLERIASLIEHVPTVFQTDILQHIIRAVEKKAQKSYSPTDPHLAPAFHVIADHLRALSFAIADGCQPGNTEQGYVLRKILRRAVRYGRLVGLKEPFLAHLLPSLIEAMGTDYPEIKESERCIAEILTLEEENFDRTLRRGGNILATIIDRAKQSGAHQMSGADAFKLKDTYGFPIEEIILIAKDASLTVNLDAYQLLEEQAKEKSRLASKTGSEPTKKTIDFTPFIARHGTSNFTGYDQTAGEGTITGILVDGSFVDTLEAGQQATLFLDETPFYAEKGGQVGDTGTLSHHSAHFTVTGCKAPKADLIAHVGVLTQGTLIVGEPVRATVDAAKRRAIAHHHTATHLLHWALEQTLGSHIKQAGSLVEPSRLRFDFTHHKALTRELLRTVEQRINEKIRENAPVITREASLKEVQNQGGVKQFFGDKYGETVRIVAIGDYSQELCGGTHVDRAGSIGLFRIAKESSIGQGIRRIEAVTGKEAEALGYDVEDLLFTMATHLKTPVAKLATAVNNLLDDNAALTETIRSLRHTTLLNKAKQLAAQAKAVGPFNMITALVDCERKELPLLADLIIEAGQTAAVCLAISDDAKCHLFLKLTPEGVAKGFEARSLIQSILPLIEGSGGGKKATAQAGGKAPSGISAAFNKLELLFSEGTP